MIDILGFALKNFYEGHFEDKLLIHNKYGETEEMPIEYYFRTIEQMPETETRALDLCEGKVLDVGAGAGIHSLILQKQHVVTSLEISENLCHLMKERLVNNVVCEDIYSYRPKHKYDTIVLLMNGLGIAQDPEGLERLFIHLRTLLAKNGQIIFESSDISYLYENQDLPENRYYGQIEYQYEYLNKKGNWFSWLYADQHLVSKTAEKCKLTFKMIMEDEQGHFLGVLKKT